MEVGEVGLDNGPSFPGTASEANSAEYPCIEVAVRVGEFWDLPGAWRGDAMLRGLGPRRGVDGSGWAVAGEGLPPMVVDMAALGFGVEPGRLAGPIGLSSTGRTMTQPGLASRTQTARPSRAPRRTRRPAVKIIDVGSPEYATVWEPLIGRHREPRPGLLTSVVRAGSVIACPPPLFETVVGRPALPVKGGETSSAAGKAQPSDEATSQQAYIQVRALIGALVDVLAARRPTDQVAAFLAPTVRLALRAPDRPHFAPTATLRRVRLATAAPSPDLGIEATALVQDGARLRAIAFRFDRTPMGEEISAPRGSRTRRPDWLCTALQVA